MESLNTLEKLFGLELGKMDEGDFRNPSYHARSASDHLHHRVQHMLYLTI